MAFLVIVDICINVLSLFKVFKAPLSMFLFFCYLFCILLCLKYVELN
jgi:hypothetical protein